MNPRPSEQKNLILAVGLSLAILLGYNLFIERPRMEKMRDEAVRQESVQQPAPTVQALITSDVPKSRDEVITGGGRVTITTPSLRGTINLKGARFDDLQLVKYFTTLAHHENVTLLSPLGTEAPYYIEQGWLADGARTPNADSIWKAGAKELTPTSPITLHWDNGEGLIFTKTISVDENYLFNVQQRVENKTGHTATLYPYARIMRIHPDDKIAPRKADRATPMVMTGLMSVIDNNYHGVRFDDLTKQQDRNEESQTYQGTGGWLGVTDKYWFTAIVPDQQKQMDARFVRTGFAPLVGNWPFRHVEQDERDFQVDYRAAPVTVAAGASAEDHSHFFAGAKEMHWLDAYEKNPGIPKFDLAVDFGWFYFMTKPFFYLLSWLGHLTGNFGVAIIVFTLMVRGAMFPVAAQSYRSMQKMKVAGPKMKELQEKYKSDPAKLQGEMMAFYRKEKVNPVAGCLPMLIQIPVFLSLYKVLYVTLEMRQAPFFGFLTDLSVVDPTNIFNLFGLLNFAPPSALHLGILPILMGITSWLQMRMTPMPSADPTQKQMMTMMPWMMMIMLAGLPAGLLLYWISSNTLGILQQWIIRREPQKS